MSNLVSLLVAAALVSHHCIFEATARLIEDKKVDLDNSLDPNVLAPSRGGLRNFVKLEPPPAVVRHEPGATTVLQCAVSAHPAPSVNWLRNGELVSDFEEDTNEILNIHPSSIAVLIAKLVLTAPSNGDVYTCVATSGVKQKSASTTVLTLEGEASVEVLEQLLGMSAPPVVTAAYASVMQDQGASLLLPCRVASAAKPQVYWQNPYDKLVYDTPHTKILPSGDLLITTLTWDDMGQFTCTAKNMYGVDSAATFVYPMKPSPAQ